MKKNRSVIIIVIAFAILLLGAAVLYNRLGGMYGGQQLAVMQPSTSDSVPYSPGDAVSDTDGQGQEEERVKAPDFTVYDGDGNEIQLSDFIGKPVVLNFWTSWCGPCRNEMPHFEAAYETYGEDVHFLMVNLTDGFQETKEDADQFIAQSGYTFPVYYDSDSAAAVTYRVYSIPMTFFIDSEGYAVAYYASSMSRELLEQGIGMLLDQ